jgi:hypothetical protein
MQVGGKRVLKVKRNSFIEYGGTLPLLQNISSPEVHIGEEKMFDSSLRN